jgi:uncharacterized integral membrane protein
MADQPTEPTRIQEPAGRQGLEPRQVRQLLLVAVLVLVAVLILAFVLQNRRRTTVSFVFFDTNASLIWVILVSLVGGIITGLVVPALLRRRRTRP